MGKNNIIKKFQIARLDEWIGDYENADIIYEEIQKSDDNLSYILKPTVKERKRKLPVTEESKDKVIENNIDYIFDGDILMIAEPFPMPDRVYYEKVKEIEKDSILYRPESLQPRKQHMKLQNVKLRWKYTISVVSRVDNYLRLEVRGYNPDGSTPILNSDFTMKINDWYIESDIESFNGVDTLLEINAFHEEEKTAMYMNIDLWGLLSGTIIVDEQNLGDTLISIHIFLDSLSNKLW